MIPNLKTCSRSAGNRRTRSRTPSGGIRWEGTSDQSEGGGGVEKDNKRVGTRASRLYKDLLLLARLGYTDVVGSGKGARFLPTKSTGLKLSGMPSLMTLLFRYLSTFAFKP